VITPRNLGGFPPVGRAQAGGTQWRGVRWEYGEFEVLGKLAIFHEWPQPAERPRVIGERWISGIWAGWISLMCVGIHGEWEFSEYLEYSEYWRIHGVFGECASPCSTREFGNTAGECESARIIGILGMLGTPVSWVEWDLTWDS